MAGFSNLNREEMLDGLTKTHLDVLIIGGGITGAGIALDAVTRGMKTGLVEMQDFAAGTSSRSTKLVHGGLRYLKQFEIKMVAEVGKERAIVYENGPHVTTPEWMMLPFHKGGTFGPVSSNVGLRLYDFLAGVKKAERRTMLTAEEALKREPLIKKEGLKGAGCYVEYKTDDARLTLEVVKKAVEHGANVVNYTKVIEFLYNTNGKLTGAIIEDQVSGRQQEVYADKIINAGGPWVDRLRDKDGSKQGKTLQLTKGVHLVFDQQHFPLSQAIYFDTPDGRMVFAIPRDGKTYVGTTDTVYQGDIDHPVMTVKDRDYIIGSIQYMFPDLQIRPEDIESSWAGLRPLIREEGKKPGEISRKDEIFVSESGLISMAGGKLTGYRKMAASVVDLIAKDFEQEKGILYTGSQTLHLPISGGDVGGAEGFEQFKQKKINEGTALGLTAAETEKIVNLYGSNVDKVMDLFTELKNEALEAGMTPLVFAQLRYALEEEMIYKPVDFFIRRTGALFFDMEWVHKNKDNVTNYLAKMFHWSQMQKQQYETELDQLLFEAVHPVA